MACEILYEGRRQSAIVIDVSRTGLFVQSGTRLPPGTPVEVELALGPEGERIHLRARVARQKAVPHQFTPVAKGGIGLRIVEAPPAYYEAVESGLGRALEPPPPARPRFRVRVKHSGSPRSRLLEVDADSADEARTRALSSLKGDWEALAVEPL
jgi:hypothetical protein